MSDERASAAAEEWEERFRGALILVLVELGRRAGILEAIGEQREWSTDALAKAAQVDRRYLLEWLSAMAAFGLLSLRIGESGIERWGVSSELECALHTDAHEILTPLATTVVGAAHQALRLVEPFRNGGGLSFEQHDPSLSLAFEHDARLNYGNGLLSRILPVVPGLARRLHRGAAVADLGCGAARALEILAEVFPESRFVGFDSDEQLIQAGRQRLAARGIGNVELYARAIEDLAAHPTFDVACAFEVIHNLASPLAALTHAREVLVDGGVFFMYETNASSLRSADVQLPWAGPIYTMSLLYCLTASLSQHGDGYGAMWGVQTAQQLMREARFREVEHREVLNDPMHVVIWGSA